MAVTDKIKNGNDITSTFPYSQLSQPQPVLNSQPMSLGDLTSTSSYGPGSCSMGQNTDQMLEFNTGQGFIHVPVDVQAGSRAAKTKRTQNAAASQRFRQSKKQKMETLLQECETLRKKYKELFKAMKYYREERDYFRNLANNSIVQMPMTLRSASPNPF